MKKRRPVKPAGEVKQKPKARPPTDMERKMGQMVVDFANAETTDAACFKHFENIQKLLGFSPDFAERAKEAYPAFYPLYFSFTESEREFLRLTIQSEGINKYINDELQAVAFGIESYNSETSTLTVVALDFDYEFLDGIAQGGVSGVTPVEMTIHEFKSEIEIEVGRVLPRYILDSLDMFVEIEKQISPLKHSISESRLNELQELKRDYEDRGSLHNKIKELRSGIQNLLNGIVKNTYLYDLPGFGLYVELYNRLPHSKVVVTENLLIENPPISEKSYSVKYMSFWPDRIQSDLAYCLIGFLKTEGNRNYIKRCRICEDFIIVEDMRRQVCYPPRECEKIRKREFQKEYMKKKRDPDSPDFDPDYVC